MLGGGNPLTVGVGIIIEVIRKNNSDYDPDMGTEASAVPSSRDPIYLGTLLRLFAQNVPKFMSLIMEAPSHKNKIDSTFGEKLEPLGFDRFKTCELMAELLHCSNMGLLNEPGSEELISTRDAQRRRLRDEGKLGPAKEEDSAAEDLTMRRPQAAPEESRRLEVTNADDDGFEEVEPSKEMSEDTSHEFVKAEVDINPASLVDEFVDEPLSPPQTAARPDKINVPFEEPDLVVAPLSPTKPKPAEPASSEKPAESEPAEKKPEDASESEAQDSAVSERAPTDDESDSSVLLTPAPSEPDVKIDTANAPVAEADPALKPEPLVPHPEDTPAPLFSAPPPPESGADRPPQVAEKLAAGARADVLAGGDDLTTETKAAPSGETDPQSAEDQPTDQTAGAEPVVGDFLKMQFVEYRVVPTILVSPPQLHLYYSNPTSLSFLDTHGTTSYTMWSTTLSSRSSTAQWTVATTPTWLFPCSRPQILRVPSSTGSKPATSLRPRPRLAWDTWATSPSLRRKWSSLLSDTRRSCFLRRSSTAL